MLNMVGDYRAAVALNNTGVVLLERGAYRQALVTLKDSVLVMKRTLRSPKVSKFEVGRPSLCNDIALKIDNAVKRMANPQPVSQTLPTRVVSHDGSLGYSSMKSILYQGAFCAAPVRIEPVDLRSNPEHQDTDLESAMILYNFAIAHICMSKHANSTSDVEQYREGSLRLLQMACSIASNEPFVDDEDMDEDPEDIHSEVRLLLSAAALKNVVQVLSDMGRIPEAYETQLRLLELGTSLEEMEEISSEIGASHSAAA